MIPVSYFHWNSFCNNLSLYTFLLPIVLSLISYLHYTIFFNSFLMHFFLILDIHIYTFLSPEYIVTITPSLQTLAIVYIFSHPPPPSRHIFYNDFIFRCIMINMSQNFPKNAWLDEVFSEVHFKMPESIATILWTLLERCARFLRLQHVQHATQRAASPIGSGGGRVLVGCRLLGRIRILI